MSQPGPYPQRKTGTSAAALLAMLAAMQAGCASLPASGPTGQAILHAARAPAPDLPFRVVTIDSMAALPAAETSPLPDIVSLAPPPTDLVGPGDVLDIAIYEAGVALFGGAGAGPGGMAPGLDPAAQATRLPSVRVDDEGAIRLPFAGKLRAMGHTTAELQTMIRAALRGMSQDPQVMVSIQQSITNSVIMGGEVARPGRLVLSTNRETLSDAVALAGGQRGEARDILARLQRKDRLWDVRLSDLLAVPARDVPVYPGDRITLISQPLSFSVMGAPNKVEQIRFPRSAISLAEAVALAGGANPNIGDAAAIFVFRFEPQADGGDDPVVYHLNMMRPGAYFISQRFAMRDKDLVYIGNARANQPSKLVQIISQLFAPIATVDRLVN